MRKRCGTMRRFTRRRRQKVRPDPEDLLTLILCSFSHLLFFLCLRTQAAPQKCPAGVEKEQAERLLQSSRGGQERHGGGDQESLPQTGTLTSPRLPNWTFLSLQCRALCGRRWLNFGANCFLARPTQCSQCRSAKGRGEEVQGGGRGLQCAVGPKEEGPLRQRPGSGGWRHEHGRSALRLTPQRSLFSFPFFTLWSDMAFFFFLFFILSPSDFDANNIFKAFFGSPGGFSFEGILHYYFSFSSFLEQLCFNQRLICCFVCMFFCSIWTRKFLLPVWLNAGVLVTQQLLNQDFSTLSTRPATPLPHPQSIFRIWQLADSQTLVYAIDWLNAVNSCNLTPTQWKTLSRTERWCCRVHISFLCPKWDT